MLKCIGGEMRRLAPRAVLTTLVNPTDVLARAFQHAFGIPAVGICVEVPQLRRWLAYHLRRRLADVELDFLGLNHYGWVWRWTVAGADGAPLLAGALDERMSGETFDPQNDTFAEIFRRTGLIQTIPYHHWPFPNPRDPLTAARRERYQAAGGAGHREHMARQFDRALAEGRTIAEDDQAVLDHWQHPYQYCTTRLTLGALAAGLAGGPVPVQTRNGRSNRVLPAETWIEVQTRIEAGALHPATAGPLPQWALAQMAAIAAQRRRLADWLLTADRQTLAEALLTMPEPIPISATWRLIEEIPSPEAQES